MIEGFKAFNKDRTNRYGLLMEEGCEYSTHGLVKFKNNGFHMCRNLEDTLRYFDAMNDEVQIASVTGFGNIAEYDDEYYGYYDMYAAEKIRINHFLTREEIIEYFASLDNRFCEHRVSRFVSLFRLTDEEKELFRLLYENSNMVLNNIAYYQDGDKDVWKRKDDEYGKSYRRF